MQLKSLVLEAPPGSKLFIASHGIVHAVELHLGHLGPQRFLDVDVEVKSGLFSYGDAAYPVGDLHELEEGRTVLLLEILAAV